MNIKVEVDCEDLIANLTKMLENSNNAINSIVPTLAMSTKEVIQKVYVSPYRNTGTLEASFMTKNINEKNFAMSYVYTNVSYAKYFEFPIMKYWLSSKPDPNRMAKYQGMGTYSSPNTGKTYYRFKPRQGHYAMKKGFNHTLSSNLSFAKSAYRGYIVRGLKHG